jgi:hypothetical protein
VSSFYRARVRIETNPDDPATNAVSPWSTPDVTDTVVASTAILAHTAGTDWKSSDLVLSNGFLTVTGKPQNSQQGIRANINGAAKGQFEVTVNTFAAGSTIYFGIEDGSGDFSAFGLRPGFSNALGICCEAATGGTQVVVSRNTAGTQSFWNAPNAHQNGDVFTFIYDRSTAAGSHTLSVYRVRAGVGALLGTLTGLTLTTFVRAWLSVKNADQLTANFGGSAFAHPLDPGYVFYG